ERSHTARLKTDERRSRYDLRLKRLKNIPPKRFRVLEHSVVVERPPATQHPVWDGHPKADLFEKQGRGDKNLWAEVIVERIGPEHHRTTMRVSGDVMTKPTVEC